jgi:hypothetical protein
MASQIKMPKAGAWISWHDVEQARLGDDVATAVTFFRATLGDDWLGWAEGRPLANSFLTAFQSCPAEGVRLHRMALALAGTANIDLIIKELGQRSWADYVAAVMALEFCSRFRAAGHAIEVVKPTHQRRPDSRAMLARRWATVEFKGLHDPDSKAVWDLFVDRVFSGLLEHAIGLDAFEIEFSEGALEDLDAVIDGLRTIHASQNTNFDDLPSGTGRARLVAGKGKFTFPIVEHDDLLRIEKRLLDEKRPWSRQLATVTGATLLVVKSRDIFRALDQHHVMDRTAEVSTRLMPILQLFPEIGALLIYEEPAWGPRSPFSAETTGASVTAGASEGGHARVAIVLPNRMARALLTVDELGTLIGSKMRW